MDSKNSVGPTKKKVKKTITLAQAEEKHLLSVATSSTKTCKKTKIETKIETKESNVSNIKIEDQTVKTVSTKKESISLLKNESKLKKERVQEDQPEEVKQNGHNKDDCDEDGLKKVNAAKKKTKSKKNKKTETDKQNISVKSSFSKFDALQKRNLIHNPQEMQKNCRVCDKEVYKMEEIKAEKNIYHKNCFRCNECNKQLKVDSYQSHEGVLYCTVHFKLLFAPKSVEDDEPVQPRKPELIIRENQPTELPPDVVRASDKPDLGLEELQQLNVRSRFQVFEQGKANGNEDQQQDLHRSNNNVVRRSESILLKMAKLQQLGSTANSQQDLSASSENDVDEDEYEDEIDFDSTSENPNADLIRRKKRDHKRELPVGIGEAMNDIRSIFEKGHATKREERREERKQEIQNIRSRLFMGKQARIKEMYQQAVADSEHGITATERKPDINLEVDSKTLRDRFEKGDIFREHQSSNENDGGKGAIEKEADVFESAISKTSRSIFMELDANMMTGKNQNILQSQSTTSMSQQKKPVSSAGGQTKSVDLDSDVVKCDETVEDVKIETSEISEKFKFFEKYHPTENKKRAFRITPPREGVVKMPAPEEDANEDTNSKELSPDRNVIAHSRTTSMMLNKFRELEKNPNKYENNNSPKPLKCFTPPPDGNRRLYVEHDSDEYDSEDDDDEEDDESDVEDDEVVNNCSHLPKDDEALREAQNAARAKQLRIKFEKWQANEIEREKHDELNHNIFANNVSDENSIESTQSIRDRFEKMRNGDKSPQPTRPRYQVNRFV